VLEFQEWQDLTEANSQRRHRVLEFQEWQDLTEANSHSWYKCWNFNNSKISLKRILTAGTDPRTTGIAKSH
jgi:hypothetical protein